MRRLSIQDWRKQTFSVRGFLDVPRDFEICFEDKWGNRSPVKKENLTPIYEAELDKKKFKEVILPGDFPCTFYESKMEYIWDGRRQPMVTDKPALIRVSKNTMALPGSLSISVCWPS